MMVRMKTAIYSVVFSIMIMPLSRGHEAAGRVNDAESVRRYITKQAEITGSHSAEESTGNQLRSKRGLALQPSFIGARYSDDDVPLGFIKVNLKKLMKKQKDSKSSESHSSDVESDSHKRESDDLSRDHRRGDVSSSSADKSSRTGEKFMKSRKGLFLSKQSPMLNVNLMMSTPEGREVFSRLSKLYKSHRKLFSRPETKNMMTVLARALVHSDKFRKKFNAEALTGMAEILYSRVKEETLKRLRNNLRSIERKDSKGRRSSSESVSTSSSSSSRSSTEEDSHVAEVPIQSAAMLHPTVQNNSTSTDYGEEIFKLAGLRKSKPILTTRNTPVSATPAPSRQSASVATTMHNPSTSKVNHNAAAALQKKPEGTTPSWTEVHAPQSSSPPPLTTTFRPIDNIGYRSILRTKPGDNADKISSPPDSQGLDLTARQNHEYMLPTSSAPIKSHKSHHSLATAYRPEPRTASDSQKKGQDLGELRKPNKCCKLYEDVSESPTGGGSTLAGYSLERSTRPPLSSRIARIKPTSKATKIKSTVVHQFPVYVDPLLMFENERREGPLLLSAKEKKSNNKENGNGYDRFDTFKLNYWDLFGSRPGEIDKFKTGHNYGDRRKTHKSGGNGASQRQRDRHIFTTFETLTDNISDLAGPVGNGDFWEEPIRHITQSPLRKKKEKMVDSKTPKDDSDAVIREEISYKRKFVITTVPPYPRLLPPLKPQKLASTRWIGEGTGDNDQVSELPPDISGKATEGTGAGPVVMRLLPALPGDEKSEKIIPRLLPADTAARKAVPKLLAALKKAKRGMKHTGLHVKQRSKKRSMSFNMDPVAGQKIEGNYSKDNSSEIYSDFRNDSSEEMDVNSIRSHSHREDNKKLNLNPDLHSTVKPPEHTTRNNSNVEPPLVQNRTKTHRHNRLVKIFLRRLRLNRKNSNEKALVSEVKSFKFEPKHDALIRPHPLVAPPLDMLNNDEIQDVETISNFPVQYRKLPMPELARLSHSHGNAPIFRKSWTHPNNGRERERKNMTEYPGAPGNARDRFLGGPTSPFTVQLDESTPAINRSLTLNSRYTVTESRGNKNDTLSQEDGFVRGTYLEVMHAETSSYALTSHPTTPRPYNSSYNVSIKNDIRKVSGSQENISHSSAMVVSGKKNTRFYTEALDKASKLMSFLFKASTLDQSKVLGPASRSEPRGPIFNQKMTKPLKSSGEYQIKDPSRTSNILRQMRMLKEYLRDWAPNFK